MEQKKQYIVGSGIFLGVVLMMSTLYFFGGTEKEKTVFEDTSREAIIVETKKSELPEEIKAEVTEEREEQEVKKREEAKNEEAVSVQAEAPLKEGNANEDFTIKQDLATVGFEKKSERKIDTIILHSSYNPEGDPYSAKAVRALWQSYGVAPHYMIERDGTVTRLVADTNIAYHAGESQMSDGRTNVNDFSIGIEILNTKTDEYTKAQYQATRDLIAYLKGKYRIKSVVGHDDIAPGRKTDPWNFDWNKL